jgi:hypothetical protein
MGENFFDIRTVTPAKERMVSTIEFEGKTPEEVFEIMGDPDRITEWFLLAEKIRRHPPGPDGEENFNVVFTFFGDVYEEIFHWDPPHCYVYKASGPDFPIKDYVAVIEVSAATDMRGTMRWTTYFDQIEGAHNRRILPVMLPAVTEASIRRLAGLIGGVSHSFRSNFGGIAE